MAWKKIILSGDAATELTGTAYRSLIIDSAGAVVEVAHGTIDYVWTSGGAAADPSWQVAAGGAHALDAGQTDVTITTPADNEVLAYNGVDTWINQTAAEAGLATTSHEAAHEVGGGDELVDGATSPASVGTAASSGTATKPPRMDHAHDLGVGCIDAANLFAADVVDAAAIDDTATDIAFAQIILTPAATGTGTTEGTLFYDSDDDHLYCYVV